MSSHQWIICDVEATCWERDERPRAEMEIIEIGAVRLDADHKVVDDFGLFVRPVVNPVLSDFCRKLTSITQSEVESADAFEAVFAMFLEWVHGVHLAPRFCCWGRYDVNQFHRDAKRAGVAFPGWIEDTHVNLKEAFATCHGTKPGGMAQALDRLEIPLTGVHHRGIDDARNIAKIAQRVLPLLPLT